MMKYYFLDGAFYIDGLNSHIPDNAIEINSDEYQRLFDGQANGKIIATGNDGRPILRDAPELTNEQLVALAVRQRASLLATANAVIVPLQDAFDLGMATDAEGALLTEWRKYRVLLSRIDTSAAPDIEWPTPPAE